jgi:branched-chain amino acid transport system permease protein
MMDMPIQLVIAQIVNGIIVGSMYALFASGLTLIWGTMRMLNFAHGEFFMLGGYILYYLYGVLGVNPALATLVAVIAVLVLGMVIERTVIHYLLSRPVWQLTSIIATLGVSIFLQNMALHVWGPNFQSVPYFINGVVSVFGVRIAYQRLLILAVSLVSITAMWFLLKHTRFGLALRATAQDADAAQLYGVNILSIYTLTFGLSAALAALAAAMLSPITAVNPFMGLSPLLKGFVVVILGGLGSFGGAILGGVLLGIVESLGVLYSSTEWRDVIAFTFLVLVIWVRPWWLFGIEERS